MTVSPQVVDRQPYALPLEAQLERPRGKLSAVEAEDPDPKQTVWPTRPHRGLNGIYSIRASDGGGLVRLLRGPIEPPDYSPDGTRVTFKRVVGAVNPTGSGALFVMNADGTDLARITPPGYVFDLPAWSPDGTWIAFQRPYGQLFVVHPDGTDLHQVPVQLPAGSGAQDPAWSPDGSTIVFSVLEGDHSGIYTVRPDGTGLHEVTRVTDPQTPDWGPAPG